MVRISQNPDSALVTQWSNDLRLALSGKEKQAVVDLCDLDIISSLTMDVVVGLYKHLVKTGGKVKVIAANEKAAHVFHLFGLESVIDIELKKS